MHRQQCQLQHGQGAVLAGNGNLGTARLQADVFHPGVYLSNVPQKGPRPRVQTQATVGGCYAEILACIAISCQHGIVATCCKQNGFDVWGIMHRSS